MSLEVSSPLMVAFLGEVLNDQAQKNHRTCFEIFEGIYMSRIECVDKISDELDKQWLDDGMAYETSHGVDWNYKEFSLVIYSDDNKPCGVLVAYTVFAEIYVENLWVDSAFT